MAHRRVRGWEPAGLFGILEMRLEHISVSAAATPVLLVLAVIISSLDGETQQLPSGLTLVPFLPYCLFLPHSLLFPTDCLLLAALGA